MGITPYAFGAGTMIGVRTDISNPTPARFGVLQDVEVDFDSSMVELFGQNQFPVAVGRGKTKVTGKAKTAKIDSNVYNSLFFGNSAATAGGVKQAIDEAGTVPASVAYTVTVTNSATFVSDLGVFYAATGVQLRRVASAPTAGQYSVSAGVYTFAAGDASANVLFNYTYTATTGVVQSTLVNQLMGTAPIFQLNLSNTYNNYLINLQLNACIASKLSFPFKNSDFLISDFEFEAFADSAGNIGIITTTN